MKQSPRNSKWTNQRTDDVGRKNDVSRKMKTEVLEVLNVTWLLDPQEYMFQIGVWMNTGSTTATTGVGVHMAKSVVRMRTMESGAIGERIDWFGSSG